MPETGSWSPDLLTNVYNVQWGGEVFVVGTLRGRIYYGNPTAKTDGPAFKQVDGGAFYPPYGSVNGVSVAVIDGKAVFVAIGFRGGDFFGPNSGCQIVASRDGETWSVVLFDANVPLPGAPLMFHSTLPIGIVWDGTRFHASSWFLDLEIYGVNPDGYVLIRVQDTGEQMYTSTDGFTWGMGEKLGGQDPNQRFEIPSALARYCVNPRNKGGFPDGLQAYHEGSKIFAKPASLSNFYQVERAVYEPDPPAPTVSFEGGPARSAGFACYAVAGNDVWVAAGDGIAVAQGDEPFKTIFELGDDPGLCAIGAKRGQIQKA